MVMLSELTAVCQTRRHLKVKVSGRALSQKHWIPILLNILQDSQSYYFFEIYLATIPFWNQMNNSCDMERFYFRILTSIWIIMINYNLASWITNALRCTCYIRGDVRENCFRRFSVQYIWYTNHWFFLVFILEFVMLVWGDYRVLLGKLFQMIYRSIYGKPFTWIKLYLPYCITCIIQGKYFNLYNLGVISII
jgi:hypothetical protein